MARARRLLLTVGAAGLALAALAAVRELGPAPDGRARRPPTAAPHRPAPATAVRDRRRVEPGSAPGAAAATAARPRRPGVVGGSREVFFPGSAEPRPGALADLARALLDEHRGALGLDDVPGELRVVRETTTLSGHHLHLRQFVGGVPVEGSEVAAHVAPDGRPVLVAATAYDVGAVATAPRVSAEEAFAAAREALLDPDDGADAAFENHPPELWIRPDGAAPRLVWRVDARTGDESARVTVDAEDGGVLALRDLRHAVDGLARVFDPNPVYSTRNAGLRDRADRYQPALDAALQLVVLPRLDGTGRVRGTWCNASIGDGTGYVPTHDWTGYSRDEPVFEQCNAYFHVDRTQERLQALGIVQANANRQNVEAHALATDQSYYDTYNDVLRFGDGGVDDAEDGDIVTHEYGHAIQADIVPDFGASAEGLAVGEGFADFLACAMHATGDPKWDPLVGSWDATAYSKANPPYLRRVDRAKSYPRDLRGEPHADGEIWSRFLWDLRALIGPDDALRVAVEGHRYMPADATFKHAANGTLAANVALREGRDDGAIRGLLRARGLPFNLPPAGSRSEDDYEENDDSGVPTPLELGSYEGVLADDDWYAVSVPEFTRFRAQSSFDPVDLDLDLVVRTSDLRLVGTSDGVRGQEAVDGVAGAGGATFLVHCARGPRVPGIASYRLDLLSLPLETVATSKTLLRRSLSGAPDAVEVSVGSDKVERGQKLVITTAARGRGAVNDLRVTSPSGAVVAEPGAGRTKTGARVTIPVDETGQWRVECVPRDGTSGRFLLSAKFRR